MGLVLGLWQLLQRVGKVPFTSHAKFSAKEMPRKRLSQFGERPIAGQQESDAAETRSPRWLVEIDGTVPKVEEFDVEGILNFAERVLPLARISGYRRRWSNGIGFSDCFFRKEVDQTGIEPAASIWITAESRAVPRNPARPKPRSTLRRYPGVIASLRP
jgi:hypothetical protein